MTFARRSRSASAWRAMARCMPCGSSTSFTSTVETLTPHGSVCSSMMRLQPLVDVLALGQQLIEVGLAEHAAQRRLGDLRRRAEMVDDLDDGVVRVDDAEVDDGVHLDRDVVARDALLARHVHRHRAQVDLHHAVDDRQEDEQARSLGADRGGPSRKMTPRSYSDTMRMKNGKRKIRKKPLSPSSAVRTIRDGRPLGYSSGGRSGGRGTPADGLVMPRPPCAPKARTPAHRLYARDRPAERNRGPSALSTVRPARTRSRRGSAESVPPPPSPSARSCP